MLSLMVSLGLVTLVRTQGNITCGTPVVQPITTKIVGGVESSPNSWPYVKLKLTSIPLLCAMLDIADTIIVLYLTTDLPPPCGMLDSETLIFNTLLVDDFGYISGSATILNAHVLVTSAQHFEGPGFNVFDVDIAHWRVYAGEHNIHIKDPNERYYHISRVILHPAYNHSTLENDIALIITREAMHFNDHVRFVCLPDSSHQYTVGQICYLPGWGSTAASGNEEVLNQIDIPILSDDICLRHRPDFLPITEICAGYENGTKAFCRNDIGSPLLCKDQNGQWYIQGIASSGGNCRNHNDPDAFEDVALFSDWVKNTMRDANYPYHS